jgi:hypothetical protein
MNKTIMERARNMRLHAGLPLQFWADVVDIVVYLINKGPLSSLDGILSVVNHLFILIKKIKQSLRQNPRSVPLLDTVLMILVITYGIMKIKKSLGVEMSYSMRRSCTKINCRERNRKKEKLEYTVLDEITEKEIPKVPENHNVQQQDQHVPQTPASVVRRSTRLSRPPE